MATNTLSRLGWHFLPADMTLGYGDGRKVKVGGTLSIPSHEYPSTCNRGMHASSTPTQASQFKKGPVVTYVEVSGDLVTDVDKFCGRSRKVLWAHELTKTEIEALRKFCGYPGNASAEIKDALREIANWNSVKFNEWFDKLKAGKIKLPAPKPAKPKFDEKALLAQLMPRTIRTRKEIMRDVGAFYDFESDDGCYNDMFDEVTDILNGGKIIVIEDFTASGEKGFVLKPRSR